MFYFIAAFGTMLVCACMFGYMESVGDCFKVVRLDAVIGLGFSVKKSFVAILLFVELWYPISLYFGMPNSTDERLESSINQ